jgi:hypothetical protein
MEDNGWKVSLWGAGQQVASAVTRTAQAGLELFQGQKVGDFFALLPRDLHSLLWTYILRDHLLKEKVCRLLQLRGVCCSWNDMLHNEQILKKVIPVLFYEGGLGPLLMAKSVSPARLLLLRRFVKYGFVADADHCASIAEFLNGSAKKIMFLHGSDIVDRAEWARVFAGEIKRKIAVISAALLRLLLADGTDPEKQAHSFFACYPCDIVVISEIDELCAMYAKPIRLLLKKLSERARCVVISRILFNEMKVHALNIHTGQDIIHVETCCPEDWKREDFPAECCLLQCEKPSLHERRVILQLLAEGFVRKYLAPPQASSALQLIAQASSYLPAHTQRTFFESYMGISRAMELHSLRSIDASAFSSARLDAIAQCTSHFTYNVLRCIFSNLERFFQRDEVAAVNAQEEHRITAMIVDQVVNELAAKKGNADTILIPLDGV